ncbi:MAG: DNA protecting protein DprA [Parcubacteria bacterium C7867-005]|nr:MAG: DNA protecting protein DprA [Parcubacteria bacterium C7867-005]
MTIRDLLPGEFPILLKEINDKAKNLRYEGELPRENNKLLAVVGSRKYSAYGREICESIIAGLSGYPITIVSGLALGIDSIAHRAAINAGLQTIAVPGSGLSRKILHPQAHVGLANEIIESGGGLLSEFDDDMKAQYYTFPQRNRIMAGMCHATLVIEAEKKSGTLITSRLATEYNREVGAVPGPTTSPTSDGPHMLIRLGSALIRDANDVLELLGIKRKDEGQTLFDMNDLGTEEKLFIELLDIPRGRDELIRKSKLDIGKANAVLSLLEIKGLIFEELGEVRKAF